MIELPKTFKSGAGGFSGPDVLTYTLIKRQGMFAVYERSKDEKIKDWECVTIKLIPKGTSIFNSPPSLEDEERYPSNNDFGHNSYSFHGKFGKEAALNKMERLIKEQNQEFIPEIKKQYQIPPGEWTIKMFSEINNCNYITANNFVKENLNKTIKFLYKKNLHGRGKSSNFYSAI